MLEKKKMPGENTSNENAKMEGQKQEPKVRGQSESLKISSLPSLHIFSSLWFFFLCVFFLFYLKKKMLGKST